MVGGFGGGAYGISLKTSATRPLLWLVRAAQRIGVPVAAEIGWDGSIAEAVDTGLLAARVPKRLVSALREVAA